MAESKSQKRPQRRCALSSHWLLLASSLKSSGQRDWTTAALSQKLVAKAGPSPLFLYSSYGCTLCDRWHLPRFLWLCLWGPILWTVPSKIPQEQGLAFFNHQFSKGTQEGSKGLGKTSGSLANTIAKCLGKNYWGFCLALVYLIVGRLLLVLFNNGLGLSEDVFCTIVESVSKRTFAKK